MSEWTEEVRARLALPVDEWWSLYIKRAFEAKTSEAYQMKLDVDAALGEIERLRAEMESCQGPQWYKAWKDSEAEVERLRGEHGKTRNEDASTLTDYRNASHAAIARAEKAEVERDVAVKEHDRMAGQLRRAEAALRDIVDEVGFDSLGKPASRLYLAQQIARTALFNARAALAGEDRFNWLDAGELAARVEKVLALIQAQRSYVGVARAMLDASQVERILNGEEA